MELIGKEDGWWYGTKHFIIMDSLHTPMTDEWPVITLIYLKIGLEWFKLCDCSRLFWIVCLVHLQKYIALWENQIDAEKMF